VPTAGHGPASVSASAGGRLVQSAHHLEAWELPYWCDFQGGAWATAAGHPVGTCASNGLGFEFAPGQAEPVYTIEAHCGEGFIDAFVPRFVPLAW